MTDRASKGLVKLLPAEFQHGTLGSETALARGVEHETAVNKVGSGQRLVVTLIMEMWQPGGAKGLEIGNTIS